MSSKIDIDIADLEKELRAPFCASVTTPIASGVLKDGRKYQIQVIITTDEDEFIEPQPPPMKRDYLKYLGFATASAIATKTPPPMTLPQETIDKIKADARNYMDVFNKGSVKYEDIQPNDIANAHEAAATEWAGKAQGLVDALDELLDLLPSGNALNHYFAKEQVIKAREELAKYKEVSNG